MPSPIIDEICNRVQTLLKAKCQAPSLSVPFAWVEGCVSWFFTEKNRPPSTNNLQELLDFVYEQWLLVDLEQLNLRSLPKNLNNAKATNLTDSYILQIKLIVNIGQSAYSQHLKVTKGLESNAEVSADKKIPSKWEPKGRRMLQLHLSDGSQEVKAVEYQPVPQLHLDLFPGTKLLVKGPVECRRGVLLLRANNVDVLGGEVRDLLQVNAPENVLARIIGKPENPTPVYGSYSAQTAPNFDADNEDGDEFVASGMSKATQRSGMVPPQSQPASSLSGSSKRAMNDHPQSCPPAKRKSVTEPPAPSESTLHQHQQQQQKHQQDVFPDDDDDMLFLEMPMEAEESSSSSSLAPRENPGTAEPIPAPSACVFRQPVQPIVRPFTYLSTHLRQRAKALEDGQTGRTSANLPESICIKGCVITIRGKLEVQQGKWRLQGTLNDGSGALDVDFSAEILEKLIGYSPAALKIEMAKDRQLGQQVLENAKQAMIRLNCLLHIRWPDGAGAQQQPVVFRLEEIQREHLVQLQILPL